MEVFFMKKRSFTMAFKLNDWKERQATLLKLIDWNDFKLFFMTFT